MFAAGSCCPTSIFKAWQKCPILIISLCVFIANKWCRPIFQSHIALDRFFFYYILRAVCLYIFLFLMFYFLLSQGNTCRHYMTVHFFLLCLLYMCYRLWTCLFHPSLRPKKDERKMAIIMTCHVKKSTKKSYRKTKSNCICLVLFFQGLIWSKHNIFDYLKYLRTEVRGDFNIHGTKYF